MNWSLVVAVNSEEVLRGNLLRSAEAESAKEIVRQHNFKNASTAYNNGIATTTGDMDLHVGICICRWAGPISSMTALKH